LIRPDARTLAITSKSTVTARFLAATHGNALKSLGSVAIEYELIDATRLRLACNIHRGLSCAITHWPQSNHNIVFSNISERFKSLKVTWPICIDHMNDDAHINPLTCSPETPPVLS
jgi:hypothetical protein